MNTSQYCTYNSYIDKKFTTRKKALRIISNLPAYCHTSPISNNLELLNIHQHIQYHALIYMFKKHNNLLTNFHGDKLIIANKCHTYDTRNSKSLRSTFLKLYISKNFIFDLGVQIWNNLPFEFTITTGKHKYKTYIKSHLLSKL